MIFFETSALSGNNIIHAFNSSIQLIIKFKTIISLKKNYKIMELELKKNNNDIQINKKKLKNKNNNIIVVKCQIFKNFFFII